ncbi:MAG: hypothetical protein ACRDZ3_01165 [Acidimicrobiia bacterium]
MPRLARFLAAGLLLAGGMIHLQLWRDGYRAIPSVGPLFLLNVAASAAVAMALFIPRQRWPLAAGVALSVGSLVALVMSRTVGVFGFVENVWTPSALRALVAEMGALVALTVCVTAMWRNAPQPAPARVRSARR